MDEIHRWTIRGPRTQIQSPPEKVPQKFPKLSCKIIMNCGLFWVVHAEVLFKNGLWEIFDAQWCFGTVKILSSKPIYSSVEPSLSDPVAHVLSLDLTPLQSLGSFFSFNLFCRYVISAQPANADGVGRVLRCQPPWVRGVARFPKKPNSWQYSMHYFAQRFSKVCMQSST